MQVHAHASRSCQRAAQRSASEVVAAAAALVAALRATTEDTAEHAFLDTALEHATAHEGVTASAIAAMNSLWAGKVGWKACFVDKHKVSASKLLILVLLAVFDAFV